MQSTLTEKNIKKSLKIQLIILFALNFFDLLATCAWIYFFGLEIEGNPIARMMFANDSVVLYKSAIIMCAEWILYICIQKHPKWRFAVTGLVAVYSVLALYHIYIGCQLIPIWPNILV